MCGINGIISSNPDLPQAALGWLAAMNDALRHRGPDGGATLTWRHMALGHRRLSIIDLTARGTQPMQNADGTLAMVCNGEIYNYADLRRKLSADGYRFSSDTDVEVILPLYERYGERCVDHLTGMFAFALWDAKQQRLILARDRVGEKPLYYAEHDGMIAFSSEIKALRKLPWVDLSLNEAAVPLLFAYQSLPAPHSIHTGIQQLAPAEVLVWQAGHSRRERYWKLDFSKRREYRPDEALEHYGALIGETVRSELVADVPVGVMLSGGVDSSTVARFARQADAGINTFCIGREQPGQEDEEFRRATIAAQYLKTNHRNIDTGEIDLARAIEVIAHYDQPMSSFVMLYADLLAHRMREEVKVVLSGNGADEVFAGYAGYARLPLRQKLDGLAAALPASLSQLLPQRYRSRAKRLIETAKLPLADRRGHSLNLVARDLLERLATPDFARRWRDDDPGRFATAAARECNPQTLLDAIMYSDLMVCHQHGHAVIGDMSGMSHGLELRAPFLAHPVMEFAAALPTDLLLGRHHTARNTKWIMKRHLAEVLPDTLVHAPKIGFGYGIQLHDMIRGPWRPAVEECLLRGRYLELGVFSRAGAAWAIDHSYLAVCLLLSFAIWAETALFGTDARELGQRLAALATPQPRAA
ncbi:asparagine synthase (glutamine-hydrolyzing) [Ferrovibrio sp.]|uniref:asparagine synthase (glutamine-hydrolyzing) n=1 Tax=Ferrovibrio sp. TaxID=1917215 RepID=UPI001B47B9E9|nr:asparagine synthase (glutamine-hydrolyzing) [Ferrovibrio sp.]MBP7063429.1 asparagine synthase (glutamine-hydrolyzing) [Ferrovibrio sp.]